MIKFGIDNINCSVMYDQIVKIFINHEKAIDFIKGYVYDEINQLEWSEETNYDQVCNIDDIEKYVETETGYRLFRDYDTTHWIRLFRKEITE